MMSGKRAPGRSASGTTNVFHHSCMGVGHHVLYCTTLVLIFYTDITISAFRTPMFGGLNGWRPSVNNSPPETRETLHKMSENLFIPACGRI